MTGLASRMYDVLREENRWKKRVRSTAAPDAIVVPADAAGAVAVHFVIEMPDLSTGFGTWGSRQSGTRQEVQSL